MSHSVNSDGETGFAHLGLNGKLVVTARLGNDVRKTPINNEDITYDEMIVMMARLFKNKFDIKDDVLLKYRDEDGLQVTISDDSDLKFAIQCHRKLLLTIYLNGSEQDTQDQQQPSTFEHNNRQPKLGSSQQQACDGHCELLHKVCGLIEALESKLNHVIEIDRNITTKSAAVGLSSIPESANEPKAVAAVPNGVSSHADFSTVASNNSSTLQTPVDASRDFDPIRRSSSKDEIASRSLQSQSLDADTNSIKSLESLNDRQPATILPSVQQYQQTGPATPKPMQNNFQQPPTSGAGQPPFLTSHPAGQPPVSQPSFRYPPTSMPFQHTPPPQQQMQPMSTVPQQGPPVLGSQQQMQLSSTVQGQQCPPSIPPQSGPGTVGPPLQMMSGLPQQQPPQGMQFPPQGSAFRGPPSAQGPPPPQNYPTPSSTPAPLGYPPMPMQQPAAAAQPPVPTSGPLGPPPTSMMGAPAPPPAGPGAPPMGPLPTGPLQGNPYARNANTRGYMYPQ